MKIFQLKINGLRNLSDINIQPNSQFNLFSGLNGSGKTSFLESIYLLAFGRSFRAPQVNTLIHYEASSITLFSDLVDHHKIRHLIGLEKNRQKPILLKINSELVPNLSYIAQLLPVQILCPDSFQLLTAGPEGRRRFFDWGVFHVEHCFFNIWLKYVRILRQRNSILRQKHPYSQMQAQLRAWDADLITCGELLTNYRKAYIKKFLIKLQDILVTLLPIQNLEVTYYQGWEPDKTFSQALAASIGGDRKVGFTRVGPQRADLFCRTRGVSLGQTLSRGQQKLFICALILAQGALIREETGKQCIYLVDDLASELDKQTRRQVIEHMAIGEAQVFITGIEADFLKEGIQGFEHTMFHVEHGIIKSD